MAHFAKLDDKNIVLAVYVVNNDVITIDGEESEAAGVDFLTTLHGYSNWKQTSFNGKIRYNYAGIGYTYDPIDDAFIAPMPECDHEELFLNSVKRWECAACDAIREAL